MPLFDHRCQTCGHTFEVLLMPGDAPPVCPACGSGDLQKLVGMPAYRVVSDTAQVGRIERRVKDYLKDGKWHEATRFADKAASLTKSDRVKRVADKLHEKTRT